MKQTFWILKNPHLNTILPHVLRNVTGTDYQRIRIDTSDGDFLDLDFSSVGSQRLIVLLHGLEGSSNGIYIRGLVRASNLAGYDTVSVNFRGCSGEPNSLFRSYHSGETGDLDQAITFITKGYSYNEVFIVGFSLGGNVALKWAGQVGNVCPHGVKGVVGVSVPCDLKGAAIKMNLPSNKIYLNRFLIRLKAKTRQKIEGFEKCPFGYSDLERVKTFHDFDNLYTAPAHGFENADHYYTASSSKNYLSKIRIPSLIINAVDDPFLSEGCYPLEIIEKTHTVKMLTPRFGGHVGFLDRLPIPRVMWHEHQILGFFESI